MRVTSGRADLPVSRDAPVRWPAVGTSAIPKAAEAGAWLLRPRGKAAGGMVERSASEHDDGCGRLGHRAGRRFLPQPFGATFAERLWSTSDFDILGFRGPLVHNFRPRSRAIVESETACSLVLLSLEGTRSTLT